jgi:hypothetical protein
MVLYWAPGCSGVLFLSRPNPLLLRDQLPIDTPQLATEALDAAVALLRPGIGSLRASQ